MTLKTVLTQIALVLLYLASLQAFAEIPAASDFAADASLARATGKPIVVMFSADYCHYCTAVRNEYIEPLINDPELGSQVIVRMVNNHNDALLDFEGHQTDHIAFASTQGVDLVPVVRFFGPEGEKLADDIVGKVIDDFYQAYLKAAIEIARARLGARRE